jgi:tetratricopeptide (TPR) repeat protein
MVLNRYPLAALLALSITVTIAAAGTPEEKIPITTASKEAQASFRKGQALVDNLRLTDAIPFFENALALDQGFALAHLYAAQTATNAKIFFEEMDKAAQLAGKVSRGEQLWIEGTRAGAYGDAAGQRKRFLELATAYPGDERALTLLGISYFAQQEWTEAIHWLTRATAVNPGFAPAYNQLGYAYRFVDRFEEAEKTFAAYTRLIPDDPNPYDSYGELLLKMGRFDDAVAQYRKALAVNPRFANSFAGIAAALMYQGKHKEALEETERALEISRNDGERRAAFFTMAVIAMDAGKADRALAHVGKQYAVAEVIHDAAAMSGDLVLQGNIHLDTGNGSEALACYDRALELIGKADLATEVKDNAALIYHYNAGRAAVVSGNLSRAGAEAEKLLMGAQAKNNQNQIRLAHELAGMIAMAHKEHDRAVEELLLSNQQDPANLYRLALAYQGAGRSGEAREAALRAAQFRSLPAMNYAFVRTKAEKLLSTL